MNKNIPLKFTNLNSFSITTAKYKFVELFRQGTAEKKVTKSTISYF